MLTHIIMRLVWHRATARHHARRKPQHKVECFLDTDGMSRVLSHI